MNSLNFLEFHGRDMFFPKFVLYFFIKCNKKRTRLERERPAQKLTRWRFKSDRNIPDSVHGRVLSN